MDQRKAEGRGHHAIQIDSIEDVATEIYLSLVAWANHDNDQTSLLDTSKVISWHLGKHIPGNNCNLC